MLLLRAMGALIVFFSASSSTAQSSDDRTAKLNWAYNQFVMSYEAEFEKNVETGINAAKARKTYDINTEKMTRGFLQNLDYQKIIDEMVCLETNAAKIRECSDARRQDSVEMWKFQMEYGMKINASVLNACEIKSRLLQFEHRYPPTSYLTAGRMEFDRPQAIEAKTYLECIKARL